MIFGIIKWKIVKQNLMKSRLVLPRFSYATNFHDKGSIAHKEVNHKWMKARTV